jgi:hypothetical protein
VGRRRDMNGNLHRCILFPVLLILSGCASPALFVATEIAPRAVNGKGLAEDGADVVTGKDCRIIEGTINRERKICEKKGSNATKKDFKGFLKSDR